MKALVTGAAGYVGSTVVSALLDAGDRVVALDDLSRGCRGFLDRVPHYLGDIADRDLLGAVFADHRDVDVVFHCAARTLVRDSVTDPVTYYRENVAKAVLLVEALLTHGCHRIVFTSSAGVYGSTASSEVSESAAAQALSPYAATKLMFERILDDLCRATPMRAVSLRCFNPIGADPRLRSGRCADAPADALGALMAAAAAGEPFLINGRDWATADGTPIRDFVHVWDLARAQVAAAHRWPVVVSAAPHEIVNIGGGRATTVLQLAQAFNRHVSRAVEIRYVDRRPGDTRGCRAGIQKAQHLLGWRPERSIDDAIRDALRWADRTEWLSLHNPAGASHDRSPVG